MLKNMAISGVVIVVIAGVAVVTYGAAVPMATTKASLIFGGKIALSGAAYVGMQIMSDISKGSVSDLSAYTRMAMLGSMVGIINEVTGMLPSVGHGTLIRPAVSFADGALTSIVEQLARTGKLDGNMMLRDGFLSLAADTLLRLGRGLAGFDDVVPGRVVDDAIEVRYREGNPVAPIEKTYEMALDKQLYAKEVASKYGINLKSASQEITIVYDPTLTNAAGKVKAVDPNTIILGPSAFYSESELANTIAHELNHCRAYINGIPALEPPAYQAGDALADYINGGR